MSKNKKLFLIFGICIVAGIIIVIMLASWIVIMALEADYRDRNYCTICHQHEKMRDKSYCYYCFEKAKLEEWKKENHGSSSNTITADPHKNASSSDTGSKTTSSSETTSSSSKTTSGSSGKTTSSSSSKKEYNTLNYDPDDYDDPDDYAEDAWGVDFDDYDDAYDFWEDW